MEVRIGISGRVCGEVEVGMGLTLGNRLVEGEGGVEPVLRNARPQSAVQFPVDCGASKMNKDISNRSGNSSQSKNEHGNQLSFG